jgi:uncharacterized glyoxalase superfamily protein PhnB
MPGPLERRSMARKPKARKRSHASKKVSPVPPGFRTVTPYLAINGAEKALAWYKQAFGAKELDRQYGPGGRILHARVRIGNSFVLMSDIFPGSAHRSPLDLGAASVTLHIYTKEVDRLWHQAVDAGAKVDMPLQDTFWGERYGQLRDPFGHAWSISMRSSTLTSKQMEEMAKAAMAQFEKGEHPGFEST